MEKMDYIAILKDLEAITDESGLLLTSIDSDGVGMVSTYDSLESLNFQMSLIGGYDELKAILKLIEQNILHIIEGIKETH